MVDAGCDAGCADVVLPVARPVSAAAGAAGCTDAVLGAGTAPLVARAVSVVDLSLASLTVQPPSSSAPPARASRNVRNEFFRAPGSLVGWGSMGKSRAGGGSRRHAGPHRWARAFAS